MVPLVWKGLIKKRSSSNLKSQIEKFHKNAVQIASACREQNRLLLNIIKIFKIQIHRV